MEHEKRADDIMIGQMIGEMKHLTAEVALLRGKVEGLTEQANKGKGFVWGALLIAGSAGAGLSQVFDEVFK